MGEGFLPLIIRILHYLNSIKEVKEIIHVAIVEDEDEIRQTLALIINGTPGYHCKHTFVDCESAIKELPNLYVNVVLMDIELPGINGIEGIKRLKPRSSRHQNFIISSQFSILCMDYGF